VPVKMLRPQVAILRIASVKTLTTERTRGGNWVRTRTRILKAANGLCQCSACRLLPVPRLAHEVDHIVPLADGGADADHNLQALNSDCHALKTAAENSARARTR
jgi:5-methylcytosine-specific restriction protein A